MVLEAVADADLRNQSVIGDSVAVDGIELVVYEANGLLRVTGRRTGVQSRSGLIVPYYESRRPGQLRLRTIVGAASDATEALKNAAEGGGGMVCYQRLSIGDLHMANQLIGEAEFQAITRSFKRAIGRELKKSFPKDSHCKVRAIRPGRLEIVAAAAANCGSDREVVLEMRLRSMNRADLVTGLWDPSSADAGQEMLRKLAERPSVVMAIDLAFIE